MLEKRRKEPSFEVGWGKRYIILVFHTGVRLDGGESAHSNVQIMKTATGIEIDFSSSLFWAKGKTIKKMNVSGALENNYFHIYSIANNSLFI